jgi:hypothetical protein
VISLYEVFCARVRLVGRGSDSSCLFISFAIWLIILFFCLFLLVCIFLLFYVIVSSVIVLGFVSMLMMSDYCLR